MLISEMFAGGTEGIFKGVKDIISVFKADPLELAKLNQALVESELTHERALVQAQTKINEIEAGSLDKFVSRWRPACGWACVGGLGYQVMLRPLIQSAVMYWYPQYAMVELDISTLNTLLFGLLGLGAYRTVEKLRGAA